MLTFSLRFARKQLWLSLTQRLVEQARWKDLTMHKIYANQPIYKFLIYICLQGFYKSTEIWLYSRWTPWKLRPPRTRTTLQITLILTALASSPKTPFKSKTPKRLKYIIDISVLEDVAIATSFYWQFTRCFLKMRLNHSDPDSACFKGGYVRPPKSKFTILTNSVVFSDQK